LMLFIGLSEINLIINFTKFKAIIFAKILVLKPNNVIGIITLQ